MSFLLPKRVKDLPPWEPESEDDKTPAKRKTAQLPLATDVCDKFSLRPKRVSELSILESDSEDDKSKDTFNCAILNESFILSPTEKNYTEEKGSGKSRIAPISNDVDTGYGDSFLIDFNKLNVDISKKKKGDNIPSTISGKPFCFLEKARNEILQKGGLPEKELENDYFIESKTLISNKKSEYILEKCTNILIRSSTYEENKIGCDLKNSKKKSPEKYNARHNNNVNKSVQNTVEIDSKHNISLQCKNTNEISLKAEKERSPLRKTNPLKQITVRSRNEIPNNSNGEGITPYKINEKCDFATPQISFQVHPLKKSVLTSTAHKKCCENEFKGQKVLFQTPYAASRPPISTLVENISLDFDDSVKTSIIETERSVKKDFAVNKAKLIEDHTKIEKLKKIDETQIDSDFKEKEVRINNKQYIIYKKLGSGGSSTVFSAKNKDTNKLCALKIVDLRADKSVVDGYLNETRLLAKLQGNINVVNLYEYEHLSKECKLYMVMEKGDSDLHKILQSYETHLPLYVLVNYWYEMLQSVNYIHENGVIHSDLKPANFLIVNGRLKLIDFGIASNIAIDSTSIIKFSQAGTFNYISPEALIDISSDNSPTKNNLPKIKISTKSDVWSLGCILYLLLFKKTPFGHIKNIYAKVNAITNPKTVIEYPELPMYYPMMLSNMAKKCLIHYPKERISVADLLKFPFDMIIQLEKHN